MNFHVRVFAYATLNCGRQRGTGHRWHQPKDTSPEIPVNARIALLLDSMFRRIWMQRRSCRPLVLARPALFLG